MGKPVFRASGLRCSLLGLRILCTLILSLSTCFAGQSFSVQVPPADRISALLRKEHPRRHHPRLIATDTDLSRIKRYIQSNKTASALWKRMLQSAERILKEPPAEYRIPDGLRLLGTSRRVLRRVYTLALAYRLTGRAAFAQRCIKELKKAASFPDWNPRHFLDTAEMSHAFAIGYDWLYEVLDPATRAVLLRAIVEKGLGPGLKCYRGTARYGWWTRSQHNWNQVCNGGLGIAALAVADEQEALAGEILTNALRSIQRPSRRYAPDGAWGEGPGYWNYATFYHVCFLAALKSALGTDFGLSKAPGFDRTGLFPIAMTGPTGLSFNFADAHAGRIQAPQLFWFAREFSLPVCSWYEQKHARPHPLDLIWFTPQARSPKQFGLPLGFYFRRVEAVTLRSAWEDPNALFLGLKAGSNRVNHSHLDLGSFVLEARGVRWAVDLGADNYNLPAYFGRNRWTYYRLRAEGHNTLVIGGGKGPDQDPNAEARITAFSGDFPKLFAVADLTPAYAGKALSVKRGVALKAGRFVLQDEIRLRAPENVWWFLHTKAKAQPSKGGRTVLLSQGGKILAVRLTSPKQAAFSIMPARPLPGSPDPKGQAKNHGIRKLALKLKEVREARITVEFIPAGGGDLPEPIEVKPLSQWPVSR